MSMNLRRFVSLLVTPALLGAALAGQEITITNARLFTGQGPVLEGAALVVKDGKVTAVIKAGESVPTGGVTIDARGRFVTPGLVDGNANLGVRDGDQNEQSDEVTPHLRIVDSINPRDPRFRRALQQGVTTAFVAPGNYNVIGGLGCVLKTAGTTAREMVIKEDAALRMALGQEPFSGNRAIRGGLPDSMYYRRPTTRMGVIWEIRKAFYDAQKYRESLQGGGKGGDPGKEVLLKALDRKLDVRTTARAEQDIRTALRLAEEFNLKIVIDEATEAYKLLDLLAEAKVSVVGVPPTVQSGRDGAEAHWNTLALLAERGVEVSLQTGSAGSLPLIREAAFCARNGMPAEAALAAVTAVPARILGVDDRVGTLAPGKDGDFVIWSGDPLDPTTVADSVYIQGKDRLK